MATQQLTSSTPKSHHVAAPPSSAPTKGTTSILSHQSIKDSLPREVIDRIKVSYDLLEIPSCFPFLWIRITACSNFICPSLPRFANAARPFQFIL
jgi:hypothetical protein